MFAFRGSAGQVPDDGNGHGEANSDCEHARKSTAPDFGMMGRVMSVPIIRSLVSGMPASGLTAPVRPPRSGSRGAFVVSRIGWRDERGD